MSDIISARHATRFVPLVVACPLFMVNLDSSILLTAIPTMAGSLGLEAVALTSLITAYLIALAISMPISGWLSDRYGSKHVFIAAVVIFLVGSLLCAMAPSFSFLIVARVVQGFGGGIMTPVARIVLLKAIPKSELIGAMAWYTTPALLGPVIGPSMGGLIVEHLSWSFVFLVNLPFGVLTLVASATILQDDGERSRSDFDFKGFMLLGLGLVVALASFDSVKAGGNEAMFGAVGIAAGLVLLVLYARHAYRAERPLIGLGVLRDRIYASTLWGGSIFRFGTAALPFLLSIILQSERQIAPTTVGILLSCMAFGAMSAKPVAPKIIRLLGYRNLLIANAVASSLIMGWLALSSTGSTIWIIGMVLAISGLLRSIQFTALNSLAYYTVPKPQVSSASTLQSIAQQISIGFGVALTNCFIAAFRSSGLLTERQLFEWSLLSIAAVCALSLLLFCRLERTDGEGALRA